MLPCCALAQFKGVGGASRAMATCLRLAADSSRWWTTTATTRWRWRPRWPPRGAFAGRRLVLAFQPHRYSRTRDCFEDFVKVIGGADAVLLTEVYAAGEAPVVAADGRSLARALRVAGRVEPVFVDDVAALPQAIVDLAQGGDVVLCMGAGSIGAVPQKSSNCYKNKS